MNPVSDGSAAAEIESWLRENLARRLDVAATDLDPQERLHRYGLDSLKAATLVADLRDLFDKPIPETLVWDHPTIKALVDFLTDRESDRPAARRYLSGACTEPIAIIGMACRFPGALNTGEFWRLLTAGIDAISEVPPDRWDVDRFYSSEPDAAGKMSTRWGGFVDGIDQFDAGFFGIAPREAVHLDPQQRLVLELAWEVLADAGIPPKTLKTTQTGVFIGAMWQEYAQLSHDNPAEISPHTATGQDLSVIAGRVSYQLGLQGPTLVVNTACSSSLVAVHLACQSLRAGEATAALAGGVNLIISPDSTVAMSKFGAMAPDGRSKAFDARADGYVRGEGAGLILLKPLSRALADGDPIYCTIQGSAVNNDGFSNGLTAPNPEAQVAVLRAAYERAGIGPEKVHYVEAHGTGTFIGDPIEVNSLGSVLGFGRAPGRSLTIGSVKTNIGHLEAAAGIAGLIKTVLAIKNRVIPPNLHYDQPNPHISFNAMNMRVPRTAEPWPFPCESPVGGVSAFGFGGTNCHVVLAGNPAPTYLLPLAGADAPAIRERVAAVRRAPDSVPFPDLCAAAARTLSRGSHRIVLSACTRGELNEQLDGISRSADIGVTAPDPAPGVVFVFPGQGGQWAGMGRQLLRQEPVFAEALRACTAAFAEHVDWSPVDVLWAGSMPETTDVVQPVLFAVQVALAALWRSWGVHPAAVVGHSMGEVAAGHVAGALSLPDAAAVICRRSALLRRISDGGAMAVVNLPAADLDLLLPRYAGRVVVAAVNSPTSTVVAGAVKDVDAIVAELTARGVFARPVRVDVASHSPQVDPLRRHLVDQLTGLTPRPGTVALYSTVWDTVLEGPELDAAYWADNLRLPVLFSPAVQRLLDQGLSCFLEISPHPVLGAAIADHPGATAFSSTLRNDDERDALLDTVARLYRQGQPLRWSALYPPDVADVPLPVDRDEADRSGADRDEVGPGAMLLPLSAHTPKALAELGRHTVGLLARPTLRPEDLCRTAALHRDHLGHRVAVAGTSRTDLSERLEAWLADGPAPSGPVRAPARVVFVFPGQGGQWTGMGRQLLRAEPVFAGALRACDAALARYVNWSLLEVLRAASLPDDIDVVQPVLFAVEVALATLWRSWGVEPTAVVGHSMGEVAAAHVAGALTLPDAARVICQRSALSRQIAGNGAMAAVGLTDDDLAAVLEPYGGEVVVAARNSPTSAVIAGTTRAVQAITAELTARDVFARLVRVDIASHSPQVDPLREPLLSRLTGLAPQSARIPLYSTVRGAVLDGPELDAAYWADNLRRPVEFSSMIGRLLGDGLSCFLEISPHPVLSTAIAEHSGAVALPSTQRDADERLALLDTAGRLHCLGVPLNWAVVSPAGSRLLRLPDQPWQRELFWLDKRRLPPRDSHPLLGKRVESSLDPGTALWTTELGVGVLPYLDDHRICGQRVLPAAAYVEMALSAAAEYAGPQAWTARGLKFTRPLVLPERGSVPVQVTLTQRTPGMLAFRCASREPGQDGWLVHATGTVRSDDAAPEPSATPDPTGLTPVGAHYAAMLTRGLQYGLAFQRVCALQRRPGETLARVTAPATADRYGLHPSFLDGCLQVAVAALDDGSADTVVPTGIERVRVTGTPGPAALCHARVRPPVACEDGSYTADLVVRDADNRVILVVEGLVLSRLDRPGPRPDLLHELRWRPADPGYATAGDQRGRWLVFAENGSTLPAALEEHGGHCVVVRPGRDCRRTAPDRYQLDPTRPEHLRELLAAEYPFRGVIHRWALDDAEPEPVYRLTADSVVHLVQALDGAGLDGGPRLWLVTRGSQAVRPGDTVPAVVPALLWGLGRTIRHEHPDLDCTLVDLGQDLSDEDGAMLAALSAPREEAELAPRRDGLYVSRLAAAAPPGPPAPEPAGDRAYRLETDRAGTLDALRLRPFLPRDPDPGEVRIEVAAAGMNFRDLLKALGGYPGTEPGEAAFGGDGGIAFGDECAGVVTALGSGVSGLRLGDEVVAVAPHSLGTTVLADARLVVAKPPTLTFEDAATIPIAFLTAAYALEHLGRIAPGERVLVHCAAGGVGLAAVQLALAAGAEVFGTAGSEEKRAYLRSAGVRHVLDSRSLEFADQVLALTGGRGVDLVLNSLSGEFIPHSLATLAPYGRFLEIGKRDVHQDSRVGLYALRRNVSFFAIDLERLFVDRPELVGVLLHRTVERIAAGELRPLPLRRVALADVRDAFHTMERAGQLGKIVLVPEDRGSVPIAATARRLRADGCYLVTGGFGGLGLTTARWLADRGARHVVLVGRHGAPAPARAAVQALTQSGVDVTELAADVAVPEDVARVLAHVSEHLPPLRGIVHAAGVLDDGVLRRQDPGRFRTVARPKVDGALNLHTATLGDPLDFFVLFSSVTAVLGSPGQSNYAAANAVLDALAHARRAAGLPALSVNWGPWSAVGMAARLDRDVLPGIGLITPEQGRRVLDALVGTDTAQVAVMGFDPARWMEAHPASGRNHQLALLETAAADEDNSPRTTLLATEPGRRRRAVLEAYVRDQAARVLRLAPSRIGATTPLRELGVDSLMSLELRNRLDAGLALSLPSSLVWNHPTIEALVPYLADRMGIPLTATEQGPVPAGPDGTNELDDLSVEELETLLARELEDLG